MFNRVFLFTISCFKRFQSKTYFSNFRHVMFQKRVHILTIDDVTCYSVLCSYTLVSVKSKNYHSISPWIFHRAMEILFKVIGIFIQIKMQSMTIKTRVTYCDSIQLMKIGLVQLTNGTHNIGYHNMKVPLRISKCFWR